MSSFLECFKNETALLRHKCLVRRLGEAGGGGVIDNYRRNLLDNGVGNWFLRLHDGADQVDPSQLRVVGKANISDW